MEVPKLEAVPDETQRTSLIEAQHISMRAHAQTKIYEVRDLVLSKGLTSDQFCVVVIDSDDPWMDDATYERRGGYGYEITAMRLGAMSEALSEYRTPIEEAKLRWSHAARCWVNSEGKKTIDYANYRPFLAQARMVTPPQEGFFLLVTFTQGSVMLVEMPDVEVPIVRAPEGVSEATAQAAEGEGETVAPPSE